MPSARAEAFDLSIAPAYDREWEAAAPRLRDGTYAGEAPPGEGSPRSGLGVAITMSTDAAIRLDAMAEELRARSHGEHRYYRRGDLHVTVRSFEGYRMMVDEATVARYAQDVGAACQDLGPVRLLLRGLAATPTTVLARGYPGRGLTELRGRLQEIAAAGPPPRSRPSDAARARSSAEVTLAVLRPGGGPEPELCDYVEANRGTEIGVVKAARLSIVRYHWLSDRITVRPLARIELDAPARRGA